MNRSDQTNQGNAKRIRVQGMHCASCVARVEKAIRAVPGVNNAEVNLIMEEATVYGDARKGAVVEAIREAGYEADEDDEADPGAGFETVGDRESEPAANHDDIPALEPEKGPDIVWLEIQGMFCASCVGRVEKELLKVDGVSGAEINLITGDARVEFTGSDTSLLVDAATKAGYDAIVKTGNGQNGIQADSISDTDVDNGLRKMGGYEHSGTSSGEGKVENKVKNKDGTGTGTGTVNENAARGVTDLSHHSESGTAKGSGKGSKKGQAGMSFRRRFMIALPLGVLVLLMEMLPMLIDPMHHWVQANRFGWNLVVLAITSVILFYPGAPFFTGAWKMARRFTADMNTLVAVGTGAAWGFSTYATFFGTEGGLVTPNDVYFDTAAVIIALILLGRWMEERAKHRTRGAIESLLELTPKTAHRFIGDISDNIGVTNVAPGMVSDIPSNIPLQSGKSAGQTGSSGSDAMRIETVPVSKVRKGDLLLVKSYEQIPVDGEVIKGEPLVDESMMTGESVPVPKTEGGNVTGGTMNTSESFRMLATRVGADTALAGIIETVRRAQSSKAPIQRLVDRVSSIFVPVVMVIAFITLAAWIVTGTLQEGLVNMVAVLLIACPCALGLATPTGIMVGSGRAAEKGILIKDAVSLEEARNISVVLFDKTGTLTEGKMRVTEVHPTGKFSEKELLMLAAAVEQETDHPIARAIVSRAGELVPDGENLPAAASVKTRRGFGVTGSVDGAEISISSYDKSDMDQAGRAEVIEAFERKGATVLSVTVDGALAGYIAVADTIRKDAAGVIRELKSMGIQTVMVTGDRERPARAVAEALGIDRVEFEVKPDEKAATVRKYRTEGSHVAMAGDGINDAAALVEADLGIAMSTGTDLAMSSADVTILGGDLTLVPETIRFSRHVLRVIRQNLFWAFVYNTVGIPLAALGFLSPMFAAAAMAMSSVSVVTNSLRIKRA
ncbi:MAG: copper-translocating P-type ATPase [Balneolaceae bacterium]|nr:MAG: copper-translocating P-type ATPase [Balneolaceae bacterium]